MRKLLMIIPISVVSMAFVRRLGTSAIPAGATGGSVPRANTRAGTVKACRRSHLSFNRSGQMSEQLIQEGQRVEAIDHLSRESGR